MKNRLKKILVFLLGFVGSFFLIALILFLCFSTYNKMIELVGMKLAPYIYSGILSIFILLYFNIFYGRSLLK
jgi:hypothetical protein